MKHYGDIREIKGDMVEPVNVVIGGSPCFPAGTLVWVWKLGEDGIDIPIQIPIEQVTVGMEVWTHKFRFMPVTAVGHHEATTITLRSNQGQELECTPEHPIYALQEPCEEYFNVDDFWGDANPDIQWTPAKDMLGKSWLSITSKSPSKWSSVVSIAENSEIKTVYNLTVAIDNSYTANTIAVHNCQDLSISGKRAGLAGERSGLFMEQIRLIKELRKEDEKRGRTRENIRPRYMVWENVPGALSSNQGADFATVLQETAKVVVSEAPIVPVPKKGWSKSGCIDGMGDKGCEFSIAWRVMDAQYFGVPQRRRRIALVADFGGESAGEILFERESVSGDNQPCGEAGEGTSTVTERSTNVPNTMANNGNEPVVALFENHSQDSRYTGPMDKSQTVMARFGTGGNNQPLVVRECESNGSCLTQWDSQTERVYSDDGVWHSLAANNKGGQMRDAVLTHETHLASADTNSPIYCIQGNCIDRSDTAGCNGKGWNEDVSFTLNTVDRPAITQSVTLLDDQGGQLSE